MKEHPTIRPWNSADADGLFQAAIESRAELSPWMPWCHVEYCVEESRTWIETQIRNFIEKTEFNFTVLASDGLVVGGCGLNQIDSGNSHANLGYWIRTSHTGRGNAAESIRQLASWAFDNTELNRLEIVASVRNVGSQRAAEKAGAEREGIAGERLVYYDVAHDAVVYSIIRSKWILANKPLDRIPGTASGTDQR